MSRGKRQMRPIPMKEPRLPRVNEIYFLIQMSRSEKDLSRDIFSPLPSFLLFEFSSRAVLLECRTRKKERKEERRKERNKRGKKRISPQYARNVCENNGEFPRPEFRVPIRRKVMTGAPATFIKKL